MAFEERSDLAVTRALRARAGVGPGGPLSPAELSRVAQRLAERAPEIAVMVLDHRLAVVSARERRQGAQSPPSERPDAAPMPAPSIGEHEWARLRPRLEPLSSHQEIDINVTAADGRTVRLQGAPCLDEHGRTAGALVVIHESHAAVQDDLTQRLAQQSAIAELGRSAIAGTVFESLIDEATDLVASAMAVDGASVTQVLPGRREFLVRTDSGDEFRGRRIPLADSWSGRAIEVHRPIVVADSETPGAPVRSEAFRALGVRAGIIVPIGRPDEPFGLLGVYCRRPRGFGDDDVHFLEAMANVLAEAARRETVDAEMRRLALHDVVTGLPNRALLDDRLAHTLAYARRADLRVGVLFIDLDRFKVINDSLGHEVGDEVLRVVATRLTGALRASDTVARFGGDEFVLVAGALEDEEEAARLARKMLDTLTAPITVAGHQLYVRASIGVCVARPDTEPDPQALLRSADEAMYRAKARGRNRYELTDPRAAAPSDSLEMERDLREALVDGDLRIVFQPLVCLADGAALGAEVLLRWQHPTAGYVKPGDFLEVAERSGLIVPIGEWVLRTACRHAVRWQRDDFLLTVNFSAGQLADPDLVDMVGRALADTGFEPGCLGLELTEHVLIGDVTEVHERLTELKRLGVKLLLDDFGTGFSSLSHLKRFPIDLVKIDRSFIEGLDGSTGADDAAIVSAILGMSEATGKRVIPEGVETREQAEALRALGCDLGQGYFFSCPMKMRAFEDWLSRTAAAG